MRKGLVVYAILVTTGLALAVYVVTAQTADQGQPRMSADNRGLKGRVEALEALVTTLQGQVQTQEGLVTALQAKQALLVSGQVYDYRLGHEQLQAQIIEAGLEADTWMIWVCAPNEEAGEIQITRDQFITNAGLVNAQREAQINALLADD